MKPYIFTSVKQILLLSFLVFIGLRPVFSANDPKAKVFVKEAQEKRVVEFLTYPARVESVVNASILSEFDGAVKAIRAPMGTKVEKGAVILVLKHTDPIYDYTPYSVRSPVSGVVSELNLTEGSLFTRGQKLAIVTDPKSLRIAVEIPAQDSSKLKMGDRGVFSASSFTSASGTADLFDIEMTGLSPLVDPATGTSTATLKFNKESNFLPGTIGRVKFEVNPRKIFTVPESAIVYKENKTYLKTVKDGKVGQFEVVLGPTQQGQVEIKSGLSQGVLVIERSSKYVAAGDEVAVER